MKTCIILCFIANNFLSFAQNERLELTDEQEQSFDALNTLQVNSGYHLHSTFVNSEPHCSPPDSVFTISKKEFEKALKELGVLYFTDLSKKQQSKLSKAASLAQDEFTIEHCTSSPNRSKSGTWIIRNLLGRRDVIIKW